MALIAFGNWRFSQDKGRNHTYFAGLDKNRRRSDGLMEGENKFGLDQHEVAKGHSREHRRGLSVGQSHPEAQWVPEIRITQWLERAKNLRSTFFFLALVTSSGRGKCKMFAEGQFGWE
jgi:hypothetical protein